MIGYVFSWYTNDCPCDRFFETEEQARKYVEDIWNDLEEDDIGENDIFEVIEIECSEEEWEEMNSGYSDLIPGDYMKRVIVSMK